MHLLQTIVKPDAAPVPKSTRSQVNILVGRQVINQIKQNTDKLTLLKYYSNYKCLA